MLLGIKTKTCLVYINNVFKELQPNLHIVRSEG